MKFAIIAIALVALIAIVALFFATRFERIVGDDIEEYFGDAAGTEVDVDDVSISYADARVVVAGLTIANPPGYSTDYALRLDQTDVHFAPSSLKSQVLVVPELTVSGATLHAETHDGNANVLQILEHLRSGNGQDAGGKQTSDQIIISSFVLDGAKLVATGDSLDKPQTLALDRIELKDIGRAGAPTTYSEATHRVLDAIFGAARKALGRELGEAAGEAAKQKLEDAVRKRLEQP